MTDLPFFNLILNTVLLILCLPLLAGPFEYNFSFSGFDMNSVIKKANLIPSSLQGRRSPYPEYAERIEQVLGGGARKLRLIIITHDYHYFLIWSGAYFLNAAF